MSFKDFADAVQQRYAELAQHELFVVDMNDPFETYLAVFPGGTNPMFRERTEHDCSTCKSFIRTLGKVVAIIDGQRVSVWDVGPLPHPYDQVAASMRALIMQAPIVSVFRTKERQYGHAVDHDGDHTFHHFWGRIADRHFSLTPEAARGSINTTVQVLERGLKEISLDALSTVIDLIESGNLYRGEEFATNVRGFRNMKQAYDGAPDKNLFVWANFNTPVARFRNTAMGTLLLELSEPNADLEQCVGRYERMVAPTNYRRPTALITPKMVDNALSKLDELGLRAAVERRHARFEDVSVNDVLFVDNAVQSQMKDSLAELLAPSARPVRSTQKPTPISVEDFFANVVPGATSISALVENRHLSNFASITAGEPGLFRWNNGFSWSYDGDAADSIKERVKKAGGNVDAKFRVSLAWTNTDDLDIHAHDPAGRHIYFGNPMTVLDVDMNVRAPLRRDAVENLSWSVVQDGVYRISVHNFSLREPHTDVGFTLEVEFNGQTQHFSYDQAVAYNQNVRALAITFANGQLVKIEPGDGVKAGAGGIAAEKWGVKTQVFTPVDTLMLSPNHWGDSAEGNKHWFFILRGALNPDPVRGIYNEYLRPDLNEHRKVFEVLGSKTKAPFAPSQLSGLGFSSTLRNSLVVTVDGRPYEIQF